MAQDEVQPLRQPSSWNLMNIQDKVRFLLTSITVEPILAFYVLPSALASLAIQNLKLEKACRVNLGYSNEVCDAITLRNTTEFKIEESEVQKLVASMVFWQSTLRNVFPAVLILFLGSFSDRTGRRIPFMLLPLLGELLTNLGLIMCIYFWLEWPMEVAGIVEAVFPAMTGGTPTLLMATISYLGDVTSISMRTTRMAILNGFLSVVTFLGTLASGVLFQAIGFYGVFTTVVVIYSLGILYGNSRLEEARSPKKLQKGFCIEFFNPRNVTDTFQVALKRREGNLRLRLMLLMVVCCTLAGPASGEAAVGYLYTRYRFDWNELDFSLYLTYGILVNLLGTSVAITIFNKLKLEDALLGSVAGATKIIASLVYAFAGTPLIFYLATLMDMIGGTASVAMRSMASKLVPSEELGKVNSLIGVCEAIVPIICPLLYSYIYKQTLENFPGAFFLVGAFFNILTALAFVYMYFLQKSDQLQGHEVVCLSNVSNEVGTSQGIIISNENPDITTDTKR